jgi:hypothetical protein
MKFETEFGLGEICIYGEMLRFELAQRNSCHSKHGNEWALNARIKDGGWWTITTWDNKPNQGDVDRAVDICARAITVWGTRPRVVEVTEVRRQEEPR